MSRPFVIVVASEKGGVGKTTIATNLAVYLKALREDLPVTIASFDNHFSVDQMFALGPRPQRGVAALLEGVPLTELATLGQYGVQYLASARRLLPPLHPPDWLRRTLQGGNLDGLLILDTRPILDWFTEAALLAADLVLVPVKDRAALVNAGSLREVLAAAERADRLWLLPSLVDPRARLNAEVRVHEFLVYAARERDYQVLDICISKSPKVESLASGFSSCIRPVLTHARHTAVHGQLRELAEFVLGGFDSVTDCPRLACTGVAPAGHLRRLVPECPLCHRESLAEGGHLCFDLRSRRRGFMHAACFEQIAGELDMEGLDGDFDLLALALDGPGLVGAECRLTAHLWATAEGLLGSAEIELRQPQALSGLLVTMTGRDLHVAYRELVLVNRLARATEQLPATAVPAAFVRMRRQLTRELRQAGLF